MKYVTMHFPDSSEPWIGWVEPAEDRSISVYEKEPIATGLLNAHGAPLYRVPERIRCGFVK